MRDNQLHIRFTLNNNSFATSDELLKHAAILSNPIAQFLAEWFSNKEYVEVNTSGSTGKPKVIRIKKEFMINSAIATGEYFNLKENTTALLCMSVNYIAGKMMLVRALVLGWQLDVVESVSNPLENVEKHYDFSAMVPLQLQKSLAEIHKIKKLIVGGGVVSSELEHEIKHVSTEVFATYGMTETVTHIAIKKLNQFKNVTLSAAEKSHYHLLPNITISQDDRKCLLIKAPRVSKNEVVTNDVVELISAAEFKWLGRFDNVINSGGIKLYPEEIEKKMAQIISQRFFVAGISDAFLGEKLVLIIEGNQGDVLQGKIKDLSSLSKYEVPKAIYFLNEFIETETSKVQRNKTLDLLFK